MPYQFPYTNLHDLDLDWVLQQINAFGNSIAEMSGKIEVEEENIGKMMNLLGTWNSTVNTVISFFPAGSFSFNTIDVTIGAHTIQGVITNLQVVNGLPVAVHDVVATEMQGYVTACREIYNNMRSLSNIGEFVSYGAVQSLSGVQKTQALSNIGLNPPTLIARNSFDMRAAYWIQNRGAGGTDSQYPYGYEIKASPTTVASHYDVNTGEINMWASFNSTSQGNRVFVNTEWLPYVSGQTNDPVSYLNKGIYTVSLKIRRKNANVNTPVAFMIGGAVDLRGATGNDGVLFGSGRHVKLNKNDDNPSANIWTNNEGYLSYTFEVPVSGRYIPCVMFMASGASWNSTTPSDIYISEMMVNVGSSAMNYEEYGQNFDVVAESSNLDVTRLENAVDTLKQNVFDDYDPVPVEISDFLRTPSVGAKTDSYLFFTDSHPRADTVDNLTYEQRVWTQYGIMNKAARSMPNKYIINGGDWMLSQLTGQSGFNTYVNKLSYVYGLGKEMLGDKLHFVLGNHDFNNNNSANTTWNIPQSAIDGIFPETNDYYVLKNGQTTYLVWNTGMSGAYSNSWAYDQVEFFANYMFNHPNEEYVFVQHMFIVDSDDAKYSEMVENTYTPYTTFNVVPPLVAKIVELANAYNRGGQFVATNTYTFTAGLSKVRYIISGHNHFEKYGLYNTVPVIVCPNFGYMTATSSNDRPAPSYMNVINITETNGNSKTLFYLVNPIAFDSTHTTTEGTAPVQEKSIILEWNSGVANFTSL